MTIPNLIANTNGAKYRSGFKKAISTLSQAGLMAQAQYDFDYAGTSSSNPTDCGSEHPESTMSFCAILNGTLTGQTFRGKVSDIKRQSNSSAGASATTYTLARRHVTPSDYTDWLAYSLADGSIVAFQAGAAGCALEVGADVTKELGGSGSLYMNGCMGFIDVNGVTLPNKEVQCSDRSYTTSAVNNSSCYVKNNANDMTDVFPIVFHDATVEPASDAAKYVLTSSK